MNDTLTKIQAILAEQDAREKAATRGPWKHYRESTGPGSGLPNGRCFIVFTHDDDEIQFAQIQDASGTDAAFIAHVRTSEPALRKALKAAIGRLNQIAEMMHGSAPALANAGISEVLSALERK